MRSRRKKGPRDRWARRAQDLARARGLEGYDHESRSRTMVEIRCAMVAEALDLGLSLREVAAECGLSASAVARLARARGRKAGGAHALIN